MGNCQRVKDLMMKTPLLQGIFVILVCLSTMSLSGCGGLFGLQAYSNLQKLQEERTRQALEYQKRITEEQQLAAEERRLAAEERRRAIEERMRQMEAQRQREQQYDETFRTLSPNQKFEIMREREKANTARQERDRASEERLTEQWGTGKEFLKILPR